MPKETLIQTLTTLDGGITRTSLIKTITLFNSGPQRPQGFQAQKPNQPMQVVPPKPNLEKIMENFISPQTQQN